MSKLGRIDTSHISRQLASDGNLAQGITNKKLDALIENDFESGTLLNNVNLSATAVNSTTLDLGVKHPYKGVFFFGKCKMSSASDTFTVAFSNDGSNFYRVTKVRPTANSTDGAFYHFGYKSVTARYIRIGNETGTALTEFTINFVKLK
tara:strand:- start:112 stop:558 length:447 start_codon:yes stop_codon:yes gene_type:complete